MAKISPKTPTKKTVSRTSASRVVARQGLGTTLDLMTAILIVSLLINLFVVCIWVVLSVTTQYDTALSGLLLGR